jgi:tetratricopeptide (TPR) repeat protein
MDEGVVLDDQVKTGKALSKYLKARFLAINDTLITKSLDHRTDQIARLWMHKADMMLEEYRYGVAYDLVKRVAKFSHHGKKAIRRFKSYTILGNGKEYQAGGFIGKAMGKYSEALELNADLIYDVNALQYQAGIQMANLAAKADEFEEIQLAIYSLEYARSLAGGIGNKNEQLLTDLKKRLKALDDYKIRTVIDYKMNLARVEQALARTDRLEIGQTIPQVQELLGDPHEKVLGDNGENPEEQLWIYFVNDGTFQLSFQNYQLFKIEEI